MSLTVIYIAIRWLKSKGVRLHITILYKPMDAMDYLFAVGEGFFFFRLAAPAHGGNLLTFQTMKYASRFTRYESRATKRLSRSTPYAKRLPREIVKRYLTGVFSFGFLNCLCYSEPKGVKRTS
jgi:hypothetical protein